MSWLIPLWPPFSSSPWLFQSFLMFFIYTTPPASRASESCLEFCKQNLSGGISLNHPYLCLRIYLHLVSSFNNINATHLYTLYFSLQTILGSAPSTPLLSYIFILFPCIVQSPHLQIGTPKLVRVVWLILPSVLSPLIASPLWTNLEQDRWPCDLAKVSSRAAIDFFKARSDGLSLVLTLLWRYWPPAFSCYFLFLLSFGMLFSHFHSSLP